MSEREYYTDDEDISDAEYERREQWSKIKDLPLYAFLNCEKTKCILETDFRLKFQEQLEPKLDQIFESYFRELKGQGMNLMYRAEQNHIGDFSNLVFMNLYKNYDMEIFEQNPHLAKPLLEKLGWND